MDSTKETKEQKDAWDAHLAYLEKMYASPARGYGSGKVYEKVGPEVFIGGKWIRQTQWK